MALVFPLIAAVPILAYFQVLHLERALFLCAGPVGLNCVNAYTGIIIIVIYVMCRKTISGYQRQFRIDQAMGIYKLYSSWASYLSLQAVAGASDVEVAFGVTVVTVQLATALVLTGIWICTICLQSEDVNFPICQ